LAADFSPLSMHRTRVRGLGLWRSKGTRSTAMSKAQEQTSPSWPLSQYHSAGTVHQCQPAAVCSTLNWRETV